MHDAKVCICFKQNSVFVFSEECFLWTKKKKEQDKLVTVLGDGKMKCFSMSCETANSSYRPYFVRNQNLNFLKFGHLKNYWFVFTCIQSNHTSLFLLAVKLPKQLPLQSREMYYYISLNPTAQLSGQSYKHRKRGLHTPSAWLTLGLWTKVICFPGSWVKLCLCF